MTSTISGSNANNFATPATPTATTTSSASTTGGSPNQITDQSSLDKTYTQFLGMLMTQLKNQDPLSPMDTTQFTSQLVSFSQVEQQLKANDLLTKIANNANSGQNQLGLSYIGLNIDAPGSMFAFNGAPVGINYNLPAASSNTQISILDQNNNVVYSTTGNTTTGNNTFTWTGTDNNGQPVANGVYHVLVGAKSASDNSDETVTTTVPGRVTGVQTASDGTMDLVVNGGATTVPMSSVTKVYN